AGSCPDGKSPGRAAASYRGLTSPVYFRPARAAKCVPRPDAIRRRRRHGGSHSAELRGRNMTAIIEARALGKQYRSRWALIDCTLSIPAGHVVGLVGPNGAGKTTMLHRVTGPLTPTAGT